MREADIEDEPAAGSRLDWRGVERVTMADSGVGVTALSSEAACSEDAETR